MDEKGAAKCFFQVQTRSWIQRFIIPNNAPFSNHRGICRRIGGRPYLKMMEWMKDYAAIPVNHEYDIVVTHAERVFL